MSNVASSVWRQLHSATPTNLYGPGGNFSLETSHVVPALIRKMHEAKLGGDPEVVVWGSGEPRRELLHVDNAADACLFLLESDDYHDLINVGNGHQYHDPRTCGDSRRGRPIRGRSEIDTAKPDGTPWKMLDVARSVDSGGKQTQACARASRPPTPGTWSTRQAQLR